MVWASKMAFSIDLARPGRKEALFEKIFCIKITFTSKRDTIIWCQSTLKAYITTVFKSRRGQTCSSWSLEDPLYDIRYILAFIYPFCICYAKPQLLNATYFFEHYFYQFVKGRGLKGNRPLSLPGLELPFLLTSVALLYFQQVIYWWVKSMAFSGGSR